MVHSSQLAFDGMPLPGQEEEILITVRAYPEPSTKYTETCCVAGVTLTGKPIRIFPVQARHLEDEKQFKKYDIIRAQVHKASSDARPESYRVEMSTIEIIGKVDTGKRRDWAERNRLVSPFRVASSIEELQARFREGKQRGSPSLALIRPKEVVKFEMVHKRATDWDDQHRAKLAKPISGTIDGRNRDTLEFIPYSFRYWFRCDAPECSTVHKFSVLDWEVHQSYRSWRSAPKYSHDGGYGAMMTKYSDEFIGKKDLQFYVGTVSSHPHQWTIIGLYYPPKS